MAGINVAAGLSEMGGTIAQVAGAGALEQQRAELQKQSMILADQLAGVRESKGRAEAHGYDMAKTDKVQTFAAGESEKDRANRLETTKISSGASIAAAQISASSRRAEIEALAPVRAAQIEAHKVEAEGKKLDNELKSSIVGARKELENATTDGDPLRIKAAQEKVSIYDEVSAFRTAQTKSLTVETDAKTLKLQADKLVTDRKEELLKTQNDPARTAELRREIAILENSTKDERAEIALYQNEAKLAETAMSHTLARITALENSASVPTEQSETLKKGLQRLLKQQEREFLSATASAKARLRALDPNSSAAAPASGEKPPISDLIKLPTAKPPPASRPGGLIQSIPPGTP